MFWISSRRFEFETQFSALEAEFKVKLEGIYDLEVWEFWSSHFFLHLVFLIFTICWKL